MTCRDCSESFVFTSGEQEFYASKGWENKPTRCEACKKAKKARFGEDVKPRCYAYERGECWRGENCKFSHGHEPTYGEQEDGNRTPICFAYQRGECTRGDSCKFLHDDSAAAGGGTPRSGGRTPRSGGRSSFDDSGRSPGVCFAFVKGNCTRGDSCRFSHNKDAAPPKASGVCYDWQKGVCERGDACRFLHEE